MEQLDVEGLFWLENKPEDKVAGRLTFDPAYGSELRLIGNFTPLETFPEGSKESVRIHGLAGGKYFTIDESFRINAKLQFPGLFQETFYSPAVYEGACFPKGELQFSAIAFGLRHLEQWVWNTGTSLKIQANKSNNSLKRLTLDFTPVKTLAVPTSMGELELHFTYSYEPASIVSHTLTESSSFKLNFSRATSLTEALRSCSQLQHLVTIGVNEPASVEAVSLTPSESLRDLTTDKIRPSVKLYRPFQGSEVSKSGKYVHPMHMLFTFDDIGGLEGTAQWMQMAAKFGLVITSLLGNRYLPVVYEDERLLNLIVAAEALQRIRVNKQKFDFTNGIKQLVKLAGSPFSMLLPDVNHWAKEVADVRIKHLVHRGLHDPLDGGTIHRLAESLYFLVVICLLREAGIPEGTLDSIQRHRRFKALAEQLEATL